MNDGIIMKLPSRLVWQCRCEEIISVGQFILIWEKLKYIDVNLYLIFILHLYRIPVLEKQFSSYLITINNYYKTNSSKPVQ